jgi:predicted DNA-binding transcriptional regulator AlpA
VAIKRYAETAVGVAPNADSPGRELISGWAGLCEEVPRSRVQIWRDIRAGRFPPPIETGTNSIAWFRSEVEAWKRSRPRRTYGSCVRRTASPVTSGGRSHLDDLRVTAEPGLPPILYPAPTQTKTRLHRQYLVQQIHGLGAHVMFELLEEIHHQGYDDLNELLERYAGADGTFRAASCAPARELGHPKKSPKEPPDSGGPYQGEQHPQAVSREDGI